MIRVKNNDFEVILKVAKSIIILTTILIKNNDILFRGRNKRKVLRLPRKEPKNKNLFLENAEKPVMRVFQRFLILIYKKYEVNCHFFKTKQKISLLNHFPCITMAFTRLLSNASSHVSNTDFISHYFHNIQCLLKNIDNHIS